MKFAEKSFSTFLLFLLVYTCLSAAVKAAVFTVSNVNDSGAGSLRQAILDANAAQGADVIEFQAGIVGTINLESILPDLSTPMTINGAGADLLTVRRNTGFYRIFKVTSGQAVVLNGLTIQNGVAPASGGKSSFAQGGGIYNEGNLTVINCKLVSNSAITVSAYGGGIYNRGNLGIINSQLISNAAATSAPGAPFATARGAAIYSEGNTTISNSLISNSGNVAAIYNLGAMSISETSVTNNFSGGIYTENTFTMTRTTVAGNGQTGFISFNGTALIENSTISGNISSGFVGGIFRQSGGTLEIRNSTITDNEGNLAGGIYIPNCQGNCRIYNSIVAANRAITSGTSDVNATFAANSSYNLIGNGTGGNLVNGQNGNIVGTSALPLNPHLALLGNYGGSTQTHRLLPTSLAINAGNPLDFSITDQRGVARPVGGSSDIGAFEFNLTPHRVLPAGGLNANYNQTITAFAANPEPVFSFSVTEGALPPGLSLLLQESNAATLTGTPTAIGTFHFTVTAINADGFTISASYALTIQNAVSFVSIRGRVLNADGRPVSRALVLLIDANGNVIKQVFVNPFGYYRLNGVQAGETYSFKAAAKNRRFSTQNLTVNGELNDFNFIAEP